VQFSATHFEPMVDGSFDYMQTNGIPMSWNPLGSVFRRQFTNPTHEKITCNFSKKYHLGSDSILLSWILSILHRDYSYCRKE
jgi:predicted oxidoreductase